MVIRDWRGQGENIDLIIHHFNKYVPLKTERLNLIRYEQLIQSLLVSLRVSGNSVYIAGESSDKRSFFLSWGSPTLCKQGQFTFRVTWLGITSQALTLGKGKWNFQPLKEEIRFTWGRDQIFRSCRLKWLTMKLNRVCRPRSDTEDYWGWSCRKGKCHGNQLCFSL